jgi:hypothetical protein
LHKAGFVSAEFAQSTLWRRHAHFPSLPVPVGITCNTGRYPSWRAFGISDALKNIVRVRTHPAKPKLKNQKQKYDWSKSTDNGDACCAAEDSDCPAGKPNRRFWQCSETVGCDSRSCYPAKPGSPNGSGFAASSTSRLQVAQT